MVRFPVGGAYSRDQLLSPPEAPPTGLAVFMVLAILTGLAVFKVQAIPMGLAVLVGTAEHLGLAGKSVYPPCFLNT
jgi:hypothetical protein